jgi:N-acetylmuramoyl-L-alanine amidase
VLNKTDMPAVIVEGGFFSNPEDRAVMLRSDYADRYARSVACAVVSCLNQAAARMED